MRGSRGSKRNRDSPSQPGNIHQDLATDESSTEAVRKGVDRLCVGSVTSSNSLDSARLIESVSGTQSAATSQKKRCASSVAVPAAQSGDRAVSVADRFRVELPNPPGPSLVPAAEAIRSYSQPTDSIPHMHMYVTAPEGRAIPGHVYGYPASDRQVVDVPIVAESSWTPSGSSPMGWAYQSPPHGTSREDSALSNWAYQSSPTEESYCAWQDYSAISSGASAAGGWPLEAQPIHDVNSSRQRPNGWSTESWSNASAKADWTD